MLGVPTQGHNHLWVAGPLGKSCIDSCAQQHRTCVDNVKYWPQSNAGFASVINQLGHQCEVILSLSAPYDPSFSRSECSWQIDSSSLGRHGHCETVPPLSAGRFCMCTSNITLHTRPKPGPKPNLPFPTQRQHMHMTARVTTKSEQSNTSSPNPSEPSDPCLHGDVEECLKILDDFFLMEQHQQEYPDGRRGLYRTYGRSLGGGDCEGNLCRLVDPCNEGAQDCRHDVYDNALAAIYLTKRQHFKAARQILDTFSSLLYPTSPVSPEISFTSLPSGRTLTLLGASFTQHPGRAGVYAGMVDGAVDVGNNAWVAMAFAHYASAVDSACYASVARDILAAMGQATSCHDELRGFMGRLQPYPRLYRSIEHNVDMFALARMLGNETIADAAQTFVTSMWQQNPAYPRAYAVGTREAAACDASIRLEAPVPADGVFWTILANADPDPSHHAQASAFGLQADGFREQDTDNIGTRAFGSELRLLNGVRFSSIGNGIQWENTASAAMALKRAGLNISFAKHALASLTSLLRRYRSIPASVLGGNYAAWERFMFCNPNQNCPEHPGGSDTGLGWSYFRFPHTAATAWTGLALMFFNGVEDANPFGPLAKPLPEPIPNPSLSCLPSTSAPIAQTTTSAPVAQPSTSAPLAQTSTTTHPASLNLTLTAQPLPDPENAEAQCARFDHCSHLSGACCPTKDGLMLYCCSAQTTSIPH